MWDVTSESLFATAALKINDSPGCGEVTISGDLVVIRDYGEKIDPSSRDQGWFLYPVWE